MTEDSNSGYLPLKRRTVVKGTGAASIFGVTSANQAAADEKQGCDQTKENGAPRLFADLVVKNGKIVTMDDDGINDNPGTIAEAMAVRQDKVLDISDNSSIQKWVGSDTEVIDLEGKTVIPGIIDNHYHLHQAAWRAFPSEVEALRSGLHTLGADLVEQGVTEMEPQEFTDRTISALEEGIPELNSGEWFVVRASRVFRPPGKQAMDEELLTKDDLEELAPDNPVLVEAKPGILVNDRAIEWFENFYGDAIEAGMLSFDENTGFLEEGSTTRTRRTAIAHGILQEPEDMAALIDRAQEDALRWGFTTISSHTRQPSILDGYASLERDGKLNFRFAYAFSTVLNPNKAQFFNRYSLLQDIGTPHLFSVGIESGFSSDCTLLPGLKEETEEDCAFRGSLDYEAVKSMVSRGHRIHGEHIQLDRGVDLFMQILDDVRKETPMSLDDIREMHHSIDHGGTYPRPDHVEDIKKFNLAVNLSVDKGYDTYTDQNIPEQNSETQEKFHQWTAAARTAIENGIKPGWHGPDVAIRNPFRYIASFVTREWSNILADALTEEQLLRTLEEGGPKTERVPIGPEQAIDRVAALKMPTIWNAKHMRKEDELGSLEKGKLADFLVLDRDWFCVSEDELWETKPVMTVVGGEITYQEDLSM